MKQTFSKAELELLTELLQSAIRSTRGRMSAIKGGTRGTNMPEMELDHEAQRMEAYKNCLEKVIAVKNCSNSRD